MDINNIYNLIAAIIERARLDIGDTLDGRRGIDGISKVCIHEPEHPARICAREFLTRLSTLRESQADIGEIAMEIMSWQQ